MAQPYDCGRKMALNGQIKTINGGFKSCSILPNTGNDELSASEKERFINNGISKYIEF